MQIYNNSLSTYNVLPQKKVLPQQNLEHYSNSSFNQISPDGKGVKISSQSLLSDNQNIILVTNQVEDEKVIFDTDAFTKEWEAKVQEIKEKWQKKGLEIHLKGISLKEEFIRMEENDRDLVDSHMENLLKQTSDPKRRQEIINSRNKSYRSFTQSIAASRAELQYDYDMLNAYYEQQAQEKQKS